MNKANPKGHTKLARSAKSAVGGSEPRRRREKAEDRPQNEAPSWLSAEAIREIVESVVIAFVLAFLFRTFEAEAFVIPTGSMAPTLLGRHKDVVCPKCGLLFTVSASDEIDNETGRPTGQHVIGGVCPNCRFPANLSPENSQGKTYRSYKGDRILVVKYPYQFGIPDRWDVAVFKYPGGAKTNFIKRVVGLPNETVMISHGDLFVKPVAEEDFDPSSPIIESQYTIARKPPSKVRATLQLVYDNDRAMPDLINAGWPARWAPQPPQPQRGGWQVSADHHEFRTDGTAAGAVWLGYRHYVPLPEDWQYLASGTLPPGRTPRPQLISDFCAYNTEILDSSVYWAEPPGGWDSSFDPGGSLASSPVFRSSFHKYGLHWVGDLAVECELEAAGNDGEVWLQLVEGGRRFQCHIDLADGTAQLSIDGLDSYRPVGQSGVRGPGRYRVMFANVDDQLLLWVNDRVVKFDKPTSYPRLGNTKPRQADLEPALIGASRAVLTVRHLKLYRDLYYIAERAYRGGMRRQAISDFVRSPYVPNTAENVCRVLSNPRAYAAAKMRSVRFPLRSDQFLVLGDNSAESMDSRLWESGFFEYYVDRKLLIGKALVIYWPHSLDRIPGTNIPIRFFPNFWRMRLIR